MTISHHLTDETLQDYAAGSFDRSMEVVIACHLTLCPSCRERANLVDAVGGVVLDATEATAPKATAADILKRSDKKPDAPALTPAVPGVPRPLGRLLSGSLDDIEWKRLAPGIKQYNLSDRHRKFGAFKLLHLSPGVVLSQHSHQDRELSLVLRGSYQDEIGRFKAGDIADLGDDVIHQPVVDTDEPCIALIATQSPVRYSGMLGRLMQPFIGI
ncbi:MAG: ChrR family anti-sigma-E factor [Gammaproteobacteria bacterium]|nr:ChrR family anti-sigma-E factor [Gammaproteobacteria bacterium]